MKKNLTRFIMKSFGRFAFVILLFVSLLWHVNGLPQPEPEPEPEPEPVAEPTAVAEAIPVPVPEPQRSGQTTEKPSGAITANSVTNGLDFTRGMVDWLRQFVNGFMNTIPTFLNIFTSTGAGGGNSAPAVPGASAVPALPSLPSKQSEENESPQTGILPQIPSLTQTDKTNNKTPAVDNSPKTEVEFVDNEI